MPDHTSPIREALEVAKAVAAERATPDQLTAWFDLLDRLNDVPVVASLLKAVEAAKRIAEASSTSQGGPGFPSLLRRIEHAESLLSGARETRR